MKITVLASGSKGNATYLETENTRLLIDAGISNRQIKNHLEAIGVDHATLHGVLLTHEHTDHTKGLPTLLKTTSASLYATEETCVHLYEKTTYDLDISRFIRITPDIAFTLGDLMITPIAVSHDAVSTVGFIITHQDKTLVYMTDIGYLPADDYIKIQNADAYLFEANYDVSLLFSSARPYFLKQRIDSVRGHLSNADSAYHLTRLIGDKTKTLILAHPSQECNTEHHVRETFADVFASYDMVIEHYRVIIAKQFERSQTIKI